MQVDERALIDLLGDWATGEGPLYRQLAEAVAAAIRRGDLPPGVRLPAERGLAEALPAARGTVVGAFTVLADTGLVVRRQGSGTTVAGTAPAPPPELAAGLRAQTLTGRALAPGGETIALGLSVLDDPASLPSRAFAVDAVTVARAGRDHGYAPLGIMPLRERVADLLTARSIPTTAAEVAVTLGVQHGIALAAEVLADAGTHVAIEDPSYPGAIDVYARAGASFVPVGTDRGGTDVGSLRRALGHDGVGIVHLAPQCASPTGVVTVEARRREMVELLDAADAWLVEDAALEFLVPPAGHGYLATSRPDRTILLGSTSKVFWGGLRVGWIRAAPEIIERIGRLRAAHDLGSPIAPQVTALRLLDEVDDIAARRRVAAARRLAHLGQRLVEAVPELAVDVPDGGLSLWIPVGDGAALATASARVGLDLLAGRICSVTGAQEDRIRISAWAPELVLDEAARRFGEAWRASQH